MLLEISVHDHGHYLFQEVNIFPRVYSVAQRKLGALRLRALEAVAFIILQAFFTAHSSETGYIQSHNAISQTNHAQQKF